MSSWVILMVRGRIWRRNKNWIACFHGEPGSGKSWSSLKIAEEADKDFNIDQVVFSYEEFVELLGSGKLKRGSFIVYEEVGVSYGSRDFYKEANKRTSKILQRFRKRKYGLIMNVPDLSFIDSQGRRLLHHLFETQTINFKETYVRCKLKKRKPNPKLGGEPRFVFERTKEGTLKYIRIGKPSKKLIKQYERKKSKFMDDKDKEDQQQIEFDRKKQEYFEQRYTPKEPNMICNNKHKWYYTGNKDRPQCPKCGKRADTIR